MYLTVVQLRLITVTLDQFNYHPYKKHALHHSIEHKLSEHKKRKLSLCAASISLYMQSLVLPAEMKVSFKKRSLSTLLVTWCTEMVSMFPSPVLGGDRSAQLRISSISLLSGSTPNTLATRLSGTGA